MDQRLREEWARIEEPLLLYLLLQQEVQKSMPNSVEEEQCSLFCSFFNTSGNIFLPSAVHCWFHRFFFNTVLEFCMVFIIMCTF